MSPTEIERCLLQHPRILDAAVIGVGYPDVQIEQPRAYIVTDSRSSAGPLSDDEIHKHVSEHLSKYKQLSGGIRRVDSIPKSAAGKILKKHLREEAAKEAAEVESLKHVEQPIPVDKHYFEHVEHVETGVEKKTTINGTTNGDDSHEGRSETERPNGAKKRNRVGSAVNEDIVIDGKYAKNDNRKRKHATNGNDGKNGISHKRSRSYVNGSNGQPQSAEFAKRRSTRINGDGV